MHNTLSSVASTVQTSYLLSFNEELPRLLEDVALVKRQSCYTMRHWGAGEEDVELLLILDFSSIWGVWSASRPD
jgi:hypothetical protein